MMIEKKYINATEAAISNPKNLKVISDDAYAVCEFMETLSRNIDHMSRRMNG